MAAKDLFHDHVRNALVKAGWTITHDPLTLEWRSGQHVFADQGAERLLAAQKQARKIAIEVKSFLSPSELEDLYRAVGQFVFYRSLLAASEPGRELFLAIREPIFESLFEDEEGEIFRARENINLLVFSVTAQEVIRWVP